MQLCVLIAKNWTHYRFVLKKSAQLACEISGCNFEKRAATARQNSGSAGGAGRRPAGHHLGRRPPPRSSLGNPDLPEEEEEEEARQTQRHARGSDHSATPEASASSWVRPGTSGDQCEPPAATSVWCSGSLGSLAWKSTKQGRMAKPPCALQLKREKTSRLCVVFLVIRARTLN